MGSRNSRRFNPFSTLSSNCDNSLSTIITTAQTSKSSLSRDEKKRVYDETVSESTTNTNTTTTRPNLSSNHHKRLKKSKPPPFNHGENGPQSDGNNDSIPALDRSSPSSSASEPEDRSPPGPDNDVLLVDHDNTYQYITIDHTYWSPLVEAVYRPHATKHRFVSQQQADLVVDGFRGRQIWWLEGKKGRVETFFTATLL